MDLRKLNRAPLPLLALFAWLVLVPACAQGSMTTRGDTPPQSDTTPQASTTPQTNPSQFNVRPLCPTPAPEHSGCLGLELAPDDPLAQPGTRAVPEQSSEAGAGDAGAGEAGAGEAGAESETEAAAEGIPPGQAVEQKTPVSGSLSPANVLAAYGLNGVSPPSWQTIALVDAYDDPTIVEDLEKFDEHFGLPACSEANGCFRKVNQSGASSPLPASSGEAEHGWAVEIATDVEIAHGLCPTCRILLVEANSNGNKDLYEAEETAYRLGASEISNSWGGEEPLTDNKAFNHPRTVITASAGDDGYLDWFSGELSEAAEYPASSPHVVAVGGTRLKANPETGAWEETVWNDGGEANGKVKPLGAGGGGCSVSFLAEGWQLGVADWPAVGCGNKRAVADVSADADPYTGVAVYDSTEYQQHTGWAKIGGTSVASPIIAAGFALAGGAHGVEYPARTLYENLVSDPGALRDVVAGSNGECRGPVKKVTGEASCSAEEEAQTCAGHAICLAGSGYDGPTGVGTPASVNAFLPLSEHASEGAASPSQGSASPQSATGTSAPGTSAPRTVAPAGAPAVSDPGPVPLISALKLTRNALAALARRHAPLYKLAFAFKLSAAARVRVTLVERVRVHGHVRWKAISAAARSFLAPSGVQTHSLSGRAKLAPGSYRLTLRPARGAAKTLAFRMR
jgi:Subtilase family